MLVFFEEGDVVGHEVGVDALEDEFPEVFADGALEDALGGGLGEAVEEVEGFLDASAEGEGRAEGDFGGDVDVLVGDEADGGEAGDEVGVVDVAEGAANSVSKALAASWLPIIGAPKVVTAVTGTNCCSSRQAARVASAPPREWPVTQTGRSLRASSASRAALRGSQTSARADMNPK